MLQQNETAKSGHDAQVHSHELIIIIEGKEFRWNHQCITGSQLKELRELPAVTELYLAISEPWKDELIKDHDNVDLARPGIECFYIKQNLKYFINERAFESNKQYISGSEVRLQGSISPDDKIFLSIKGPWEDEQINNSDLIDLARPGIEHFYSKQEDVQVVIIVNGTPHNWDKKKISFKEIIIFAFGKYIEKLTMVYTVAYEDGPKQNQEGSMFPNQEVFVKNKMLFHATATDKS